MIGGKYQKTEAPTYSVCEEALLQELRSLKSKGMEEAAWYADSQGLCGPCHCCMRPLIEGRRQGKGPILRAKREEGTVKIYPPKREASQNFLEYFGNFSQ